MPLSNFGLVATFNGRTLFRSACPDSEGMSTLDFLSVRKIYKLSEEDEGKLADERNMFKGIVEGRPFNKIFRSGSTHEVVTLCMEIKGSLNYHNTLIHCVHGRDRTGLICAAFKLIFVKGATLKSVNEDRKHYGVTPLIGLVDYGDSIVLKEIFSMKEKGIV